MMWGKSEALDILEERMSNFFALDNQRIHTEISNDFVTELAQKLLWIGEDNDLKKWAIGELMIHHCSSESNEILIAGSIFWSSGGIEYPSGIRLDFFELSMGNYGTKPDYIFNIGDKQQNSESILVMGFEENYFSELIDRETEIDKILNFADEFIY